MGNSRFLWEKEEDALCGTHVARESMDIEMKRRARVIDKNTGARFKISLRFIRTIKSLHQLKVCAEFLGMRTRR